MGAFFYKIGCFSFAENLIGNSEENSKPFETGVARSFVRFCFYGRRWAAARRV